VDTPEEVILAHGTTDIAERKRYTEDFKREAVRLLETRSDRTIADVGLGVAQTLRNRPRIDGARTVA
jgi:hypothetical protein